MEAQQKQCIKCGIVKPFDDFFKNSAKKDGLQNYCKQCGKSYCRSNPIMTQTRAMVCSARKRAIYKKLPFDIDNEYVRSLVVSYCPVFGTPLEWSVRREKKAIVLPNSPSLDRIDPSKGYVKGNVWIISNKANSIKNNATHEELKLVTEAVGRAIVDSLDW